MAALPQVVDPTLEAADRALEGAQKPYRSAALGMGQVGGPCPRRLWYQFWWVMPPELHRAAMLKVFEDGHTQEDVAAKRLRLVDGVTLITLDPETGRQIRCEEFGGHFKGFLDGVILGLKQAPKTWHVWDHKNVKEAKVKALAKAKAQHGEKAALKEWDQGYWAQAQLYMHFEGIDRHYLTCSTPGGRSWISVRTDYDAEAAQRLIEKARRIIFAEQPPPKISTKPDYFECGWCYFNDLCHGDAWPQRNCRTCLASTPREDGTWHCGLHDIELDKETQEEGCSAHLYRPPIVPGEQIDANERERWVLYRLRDGTEWFDGEEAEAAA